LADEQQQKWRFRDALHERNTSDLFWSAVKLYLEKGEDAAVEGIKGDDPHIIQNIAVKHLTDSKSVMFAQVTRGTLAFIVLRLLFRIGCTDCIKNLVRDCSGSIYITVGLSRFIEETKEAGKFLNELLLDEEAGLEMMKALRKSSTETISSFLNIIKEVARNDIGEKQYMALGMLAEHMGAPEVKQIFIGFLDDWDSEVRKVSALALLSAKKDSEIAAAAKRALEIETDEGMKPLLKRLAEGVKDDTQRAKRHKGS
jgi:hypothetical protein